MGRQLAEVLVQRQHGKRPVTLIGFSLGARVIYYCLVVRSLLQHVLDFFLCVCVIWIVLDFSFFGDNIG